MKKHFVLYYFLIGLLSFFSISCYFKDGTFKKTRTMMGTVIEVSVIDNDGKKAGEAIEEVFNEIKRIEKLMSYFDDESEVSKINKLADSLEVEIREETFLLIKKSLEISRRTNGAFDITVAPLLDLWGFGKGAEKVPGEQDIKNALNLVNYKNIKLNDKNKAIMFLKKGMKINLGGIVKGYALKKCKEKLEYKKINKAIINIGGDIAIIGKLTDRKWRIGIRHPREQDNLIGVLEIDSGIVLTSGDYMRHFMVNGKQYHHIMNTVKGYPAEECAGVTLLLDDSLNPVDLPSLAVFVLGSKNGMNLIKKNSGADGIIITSKGRMLVSKGLETKDDINEKNPVFVKK